MKNLLFGSMIFCLLLLSCKWENKEAQNDAVAVEDDENKTKSEHDEESEAEELDFTKKESLQDIWERVSNKDKSALLSVDELKSILPARVLRMDRTNLKAEGGGAFGYNFNTVSAVYDKENKNIKIELIDFGGIPAIAFAIAAWTKSDFHHEDEQGYEKVTEFKGYKSYEKSDTEDGNSSLAVLYKDRLLVNVSAHKVTMEDIKELMEDELFDELDDLKWTSPK